MNTTPGNDDDLRKLREDGKANNSKRKVITKLDRVISLMKTRPEGLNRFEAEGFGALATGVAGACSALNGSSASLTALMMPASSVGTSVIGNCTVTFAMVWPNIWVISAVRMVSMAFAP